MWWQEEGIWLFNYLPPRQFFKILPIFCTKQCWWALTTLIMSLLGFSHKDFSDKMKLSYNINTKIVSASITRSNVKTKGMNNHHGTFNLSICKYVLYHIPCNSAYPWHLWYIKILAVLSFKVTTSCEKLKTRIKKQWITVSCWWYTYKVFFLDSAH